MKLLTKEENSFLKVFINRACGFVGCAGVYLEILILVRHLLWAYPMNWIQPLIFFPLWIFLIILGRKGIPYYSIYFWLIFVFWAGINLIQLAFSDNPNLRNMTIFIYFIIVAIFLIIRDKRLGYWIKKKGTMKK